MTVYSIEPTKLCQLCKERKPLIAFPSQPRNRDNLDSRFITKAAQKTIPSPIARPLPNLLKTH